MLKRPQLFVVFAAFTYACFLVFNRAVLVKGISPLQFTAGSLVCSAMLALAFLFKSGKIAEVKKLDRRSWAYILILAVVMGLCLRILLFVGQSLTTATTTGFLLRVAPLSALVLGYLFMKEKLAGKQVAAMLLMMLGVYLLGAKGMFSFDFGSGLILLAGLLVGFDHAFARTIMKRGISAIAVSCLEMVIGAILLSSFVFFFEGLSLSEWPVFLVSGVLYFVSLLLRNSGLKNLKAGFVSSLLLLSPVFSAILGIGLLGETISFVQLLGGLVILGGGYLIIKFRS